MPIPLSWSPGGRLAQESTSLVLLLSPLRWRWRGTAVDSDPEVDPEVVEEAEAIIWRVGWGESTVREEEEEGEKESGAQETWWDLPPMSVVYSDVKVLVSL